MAQVSTRRGGVGASVRRKAHELGRRAGLSPVSKAVVAGLVLVGLFVTLACARLLSCQPTPSFSIERGETAPAAESAIDEASAQGEKDAAEEAPSNGPPVVVVHVDGMVVNPGVYQLQGESLRMNDAVEAAGGLADGADTSRVNLAEPLSDGQKVHVPAIGEEDAGTGGTSPSLGTMPSTETSAASSDGIVNINTATAAELTTLPGVGEATAAEIVRDREANGAFASIEDLMRVSGIGEKKFAKLKDKIRV